MVNNALLCPFERARCESGLNCLSRVNYFWDGRIEHKHGMGCRKCIHILDEFKPQNQLPNIHNGCHHICWLVQWFSCHKKWSERAALVSVALNVRDMRDDSNFRALICTQESISIQELIADARAFALIEPVPLVVGDLGTHFKDHSVALVERAFVENRIFFELFLGRLFRAKSGIDSSRSMS